MSNKLSPFWKITNAHVREYGRGDTARHEQNTTANQSITTKQVYKNTRIMAQCKQNAQEFVQNTFNPHLAVLCSPDAEVLCQKNNLTFVELVQPFCRLTSEGDHVFIIENSVTGILYCTIAGMLARIWLMFCLSCKTSKSGRTVLQSRRIF